MRVLATTLIMAHIVMDHDGTSAWLFAARPLETRRYWSAVKASSFDDDSHAAQNNVGNDHPKFAQYTTEKGSIRDSQYADNGQRHHHQHHPLASKAARATYRWAAHFVARHNLCPWAERSVRTKDALQIVIVEYHDDMDTCLETIATQFHETIESERADANTAIVFCVILPPVIDEDNNHWTTDFESFYDWYLTAEDAWFDRADEDPSHVANLVTLAPFHPSWQFATDDDNDDNDDASSSDSCSSSIEKQSPYPTISMVSTRVIERAGEAATQQIIDSNRQTLATKSTEEWKRLYQHAVFDEKS